MRIVLISTSYPRFRGDPGGHFVETEALALAEQGHEVHVIAPGSGKAGTTASLTVWRAGGGSLFGFPGVLARAQENPFRLVQLSDFLLGSRRWLSALDPIDRVIAHFIVPCGYPLALGASAAIEVVLHGSDVGLVCSLPMMVRSHLMRRLLARGARFRFVSESLRTKFLGGLEAPQRAAMSHRSCIQAAPISVDRATAADVRRCRSILGRDDRPRWVACARLVPSKRIDLAIHEAARCRAQLTVIGDGPSRASLEKLAVASELPVRFLGQLSRHEALAFIESADKLIHTSEAEGAPTVIREARALGIPVLATPSGDVAQWAQADPGIELLVRT